MWTPHEVRKLIAQVAGVALGIAGLLMMLEDLSVTGLIALSSSLSSGNLSRGSVGLLLLCLALLLVALPALWGAEPISGLRDPTRRFKLVATAAAMRRFVIVTAAGVALSVSAQFGGEFLSMHDGSRVGLFLQLAGTALGVLSSAMLVFLGFAWVDLASPRASTDGRKDSEH